MLESLATRKAALRLELGKLDALALDYAGVHELGYAGCHLQRAIDFLEEILVVVPPPTSSCEQSQPAY